MLKRTSPPPAGTYSLSRPGPAHKPSWPASGADLVGRPGLFLEDGNKTNFNYSHLGIREGWGGGGAKVGSKV